MIQQNPGGPEELFQVPVLDRFLLYAPLHGFGALVAADVAEDLQRQIQRGNFNPATLSLDGIPLFQGPPIQPQSPQPGLLRSPLFLGLITTRNCNMGCKYCDFNAPKTRWSPMGINLARECIDAYINLLSENHFQNAEIQFFGGEPFFHPKLVEFAVCYAWDKAGAKGITMHFEVTTNGYVSTQRAEWIADNFDAVILSFDGPEEIQNLHRPLKNGRGSFATVSRAAQIIGQGSSELIVRMCVSSKTISSLPMNVRWIAENFVVSKVCIEALTPSALSIKNGIEPPDPWHFGTAVLKAAEILEKYGIETITSGTDIEQLQTSYCPVGKDAIIIDPEGNINACYLLEEDWKKEGFNLRYGQYRVNNQGIGTFEVDIHALGQIHAMAEIEGFLCTNCFCKYHCAGGCHVNHRHIIGATSYDPVCIQTRLITAGKLLKQIGAGNILENWLSNSEELISSISNLDKRLL